jgi:hypothetical protein
MGEYGGLIPEQRTRITEIQDLLIERYVELEIAVQSSDRVRVQEIEV